MELLGPEGMIARLPATLSRRARAPVVNSTNYRFAMHNDAMMEVRNG
jgi:hypothetical protein